MAHQGTALPLHSFPFLLRPRHLTSPSTKQRWPGTKRALRPPPYIRRHHHLNPPYFLFIPDYNKTDSPPSAQDDRQSTTHPWPHQAGHTQCPAQPAMPQADPHLPSTRWPPSSYYSAVPSPPSKLTVREYLTTECPNASPSSPDPTHSMALWSKRLLSHADTPPKDKCNCFEIRYTQCAICETPLSAHIFQVARNLGRLHKAPTHAVIVLVVMLFRRGVPLAASNMIALATINIKRKCKHAVNTANPRKSVQILLR